MMPNNSKISSIQFSRRRNVMFVAHANKISVHNLNDHSMQKREMFQLSMAGASQKNEQ